MSNLYFDEQIKKGAGKNIGILTLWTEKDAIIKGLNESDYVIVGQLYSKAGINAVIRNVFARPEIRYLVICGMDKSGSGTALLKLKENGIDQNHCIIGVENGDIEKEIPKDAVDLFRKSIELIDLRNIFDTAKIKYAIKDLQPKEPFTSPKQFPEPKIEPPDTYPSDESVFKIKGKYVGEVWLKVLKNIIRFGEKKEAHHSTGMKELLNVVSVITEEDPDNIKWEGYFNFTREELDNYFPQVLTTEPVPSLNYTYGIRLMAHNSINQIDTIKEKLKKEKHTRRAVAVAWNVKTDNNSDHPPCLTVVQCFIQKNRLFMNVYFRSNDMYRGWPQNCFAFRKMQKEIAEDVGLGMGSLTFNSASAHIYEENFEDVKKLLEKHSPHDEFEYDPRGNLIISLDNGEIKAAHALTDGKVLKEYRGKRAFDIFKQIDRDFTISFVIHAMDIGAELQKAEIALKLGIHYKQDRPLEFKNT